ncbi:hypothetical protein [Acidiphilium iwatense]|uniref:hypothetical protein n=1 Tax=Acidiphilium iwatense TaxID=768198 RepID=UPI001F412707|nr:hypothetical protein [Acidiphilium iwatense]
MPIAGCASIVDGTNQTLSVQTTAAGQSLAGAQCALKSNKGTWFVNTPGTVTVHRAYDNLNIKCAKAGYQPGIATVASSTKGMAFGNVLFGGVIGAGVDMADGAAYNYPKLIKVPMQPAVTASAAPTAATVKPGQPVD